jgi:DNA polymerase III subunit gamma/tau
MALDTRYRPQTYGDVLGQEATVSILKQFVVEGRGFHQSYVFCGQHGSGKTTLGRILARALLCEAPVDGAPCDQCPSCQTFLSGDTHECFEELDAATKSGKADLARIIEDVSYSTVSGKRRIYLFDESHRLSKQALDALLKPMEDSAPGSEDKRLVCIFCTTEPEKMVSTIFSRCAPAFVIRSAPLESIADRLAFICGQENIDHDRDALMLIAEQSGSHIRDAIKMVEGVSMLGGVTRDNASKYLHLDANDSVLDLLEALGSDLPKAVESATRLASSMSPSGAYERMAEAALLVYRVHLGVSEVPMKWNTDRITALAARGEAMLNIAQRYAAPPHRPTAQTLVLDSASMHHLACTGTWVSGTPVVVAAASPPPPPPPSRDNAKPASEKGAVGIIPHDPKPPISAGTTHGVYVDPRAIGKGPSDRSPQPDAEATVATQSGGITPSFFRDLVRQHLREMKGGRTGRNHMVDS